MKPNKCTMYTVISKRGVYYGKEIGAATYPQTLLIFKEDAEEYAKLIKKKWNIEAKVIEVEITPL